MKAEIGTTIAEKIGFASHQNAIPVLKELSVTNSGTEHLENLALSLSADPEVLEARTWKFDAIAPGASIHVADCDVKLNGGFLADLRESVIGEVRLQLFCGEKLLTECSHSLEILARNHWGGCGSMAELLPAFCMPNDPAVDRILKAASEVLRRAGKAAGIDGYESKSRSRVWELTSAIWSAVAGLQLSYALPPSSFEDVGQKIRTPSAIDDGRLATCLDSALLFAAALEQARLNPLLIIIKEHAFVGVWLQPQEFTSLITDEAAAIRKRIELNELVVFETTLITSRPVPGFSDAVEAAKRQLIADERFEIAIDIRRARMQRIRPLGFSDASPGAAAAPPEPSASEALEEAPLLPAFDAEIEVPSQSSADRITQWQRKLLDLTARNRLLHLPDGSRGIPLVCPDPAALEDRLAAGRRIKITAMPDFEAGGRAAALHAQRHQENLAEVYASEALARNEVLSSLSEAKLESGLVTLYRKARSDMEEGGANTLFLAVGFLDWKRDINDSRTFRAPLLLVPVKLERRSALSSVTMLHHEDEPRFNLTLLEMLRQDFELTIPGLEGELPSDENGLDVERIWNLVRHAVRDVPGFELKPDVVLSTFSFAKYLMWKDLVDRREHLTKSPLVRHLLERKGTDFRPGEELPRPEELDRKIDPSHLFLPLPADSSQVAAVVASAEGFDFVLDGPPGTGKSQTIANMIAHNLALGRRVLFVAEKMAALEVVHRRLRQKGLGPFCLELHSNKTSKAEVLRQLDQAWETRDRLSSEQWQRESARVQQLRDRLNQVVAFLHERHPNGMTLHEAIGRVVRDGDDAMPRLSWPSPHEHDQERFALLQSIAHRLERNLIGVADVPEEFGLIARSEWSNTWQESLSAMAFELPRRIPPLLEAVEQLLKSTSLPIEVTNAAEVGHLMEYVRSLLQAYGHDLIFSFAPDAPATITAAQRFLELLPQYRELENSLSAKYVPEAARRIDISAFQKDWSKAEKKFWFFATLAKNSVAEELAAQGGVTKGDPDVPNDLQKLASMRTLLEELDQLASCLTGLPGWAFLSSDLSKISAALDLHARLQSVLRSQITSPEQLVGLRSATKALVLDANGLLAPDGFISLALAKVEKTYQDFVEIAERFGILCGLAPDQVLDFVTLREVAQKIQERQSRLKAWCDWFRVRQEAVALGLAPLVEAVEMGSIPSDAISSTFETAYARWFAAGVIDTNAELRQFVSAEHASDIEAYRALTDQLSELSVRYIRAKVCGEIPAKEDISRRDGFGILKRELQKQRRHKPIRQLAIEMGDALTRLAPCMLMSPLSIAQYLPPDQELFDLVIFDEASQITPWDAIGSIARGRQVVIAGDPRQMPPTNFFNRAATVVEGDDMEEDMESILDECLGAGVPRLSLNWHYRSRHESLIAFSNHRYYESNLVTFPAAVTRESAVTWQRVHGLYAKGRGRINQVEAEAMVAETVRRLTDPAFVRQEKTLAIVTLNTEQQHLVEDLLDKARTERPEIEPFFSLEHIEPVIVKNLETVQGDERDLILLGVGYGPTQPAASTMSMNFGPLNREGGWRRLNVAVTRAREEMMLFTSFDASMIDLNRTGARAVRDLKHFIEFADRGPKALTEATNGSVGGYDSPFEEAVARRLAELGWQVIPQIGVSRFRIDLGIVHPDRPGDYLAGVECDGATYHRAATARDRDKVRATVLEGLGWKLIRIWSTDWWIDQETAVERLHTQLSALLEKARNTPEDSLKSATPTETGERLPDESHLVADSENVVPSEILTSVVAETLTKPEAVPYRAADLSLFGDDINPEKFYDSDYTPFLQRLITFILEEESPIQDLLLVQKIARAHGFRKSGRLIRERVLQIAEEHFCLRPDPIEGHFVWLSSGAPVQWHSYRTSDSGDSTRKVEEIPYEELRAAAASHPGDTAVNEIASAFGLRRVSSTMRKRIEAAIAMTRQ